MCRQEDSLFMRYVPHLILSVSLFTCVGCGTPSNSTSSDKPSASKGEGKGSDTAAAKATKLNKVNLTVDLPSDASVMDGMSENSVMISTSAATLTVSLA